MNYEEERKRQLRHEIKWLENEIKTVKKEKHKRDLQRQIKEREYELHLGIFK